MPRKVSSKLLHYASKSIVLGTIALFKYGMTSYGFYAYAIIFILGIPILWFTDIMIDLVTQWWKNRDMKETQSATRSINAINFPLHF